METITKKITVETGDPAGIEVVENPLKKELLSAMYTFLAGFVLGVIPLVDKLSWDNIDVAVIYGLLITGLRSGVKVLGEYIIPKAVAWAKSKMK